MNAQPDFKRIRRVEPVIKADELAYVTFERKDADRMVRFLTDFGLVPVEGTSGSFFFRGRGTNPFCVEIVPSDRDHLVGLGFMAKSPADLETLAAASGCAVEDSDKPGGGKRVRLTDPDGSLVDVICGFTPASPLETRQDLLPANTPRDKRRINEGVRTPLAPTPIHRLGHVVLFTPDFAATTNWYMKWLGFLPTDILTPADGNPCGGFFRLNRGANPADHHNLAVFASGGPGVHHVSFESLDVDEIGQGQQYLKATEWTHFWGIGRHLLGSQFYDYWLDPTGLEWEHYADGDVMTEDFDEGYFLVNRGELWAWGDDLPESTRTPPEAIAEAPPHLKGLLTEWAKSSRPWLP